MVIRLLDRGTLFDIESLEGGQETGITMKAKLYDTEKNTLLLFEGKEFYKHCASEISTGERFALKFYKGALECSLHAKFNRVFTKFSVDLVEFEAISGIEERNRRSAPRLEMALPIKLYETNANGSEALVCSGQSFDISTEAVCFLSNQRVDVPKDNNKFYVEFTLCRFDRFHLRAKMVRRGSAPQSVQYKYDYALIFDYSDDPEEKSRLITSFLKDGMERRK